MNNLDLLTDAMPSYGRVPAQVMAKAWRDHLVKHVTVTRNYGVKGGWLRCEFYTHPSGDPTGLVTSRIEYEVSL